MTPGPRPALQIMLLGPPRWQHAGGAGALSALDAALIAMLALEGPQPRDAIAGRLWPEVSQTKANNNLRQHVRRLREDTGHRLFDAETTYRLLPEDLRIDVLDVQAQPAEALLDGDLLAGCEFGAHEFLNEWVGRQREALRRARADALAGHAAALEKTGELAAAIRLATRIVELAPAQEHAWRLLMRLHYLRGDHTAAVEAFERFELRLREDTGARPGPETLSLLTTIERGVRKPQPALRMVPVSLVRPPLRVGREPEWLAMGRAWSAGRAFLLLGEAGIGKTRLLGDWAAEWPGTLVERARAGDAAEPFSLLRRLLRAVLSGEPGRVAVQAPAELRSALAHLLPELSSGTGPPAQAAQEAALRHAVETLLQRAAAAGLGTLVLDDLHFADLASLEMLRWLNASPALRTLRLGLAARPPDEGAAGSLLRAWMDDSQRPEPVALAPLPASAVQTLVEALELPGWAGPDLAARLHLHTGGHPLFVLETLKDAWLHGHDPAQPALPKPRTVHTLLARRLRELPADALDLVRLAAVANGDLDAVALARLLGTRPLALGDSLAMLEQLNILSGLRFEHDLMQECALQLVPEALRSALHAMVADALAAMPQAPPARVAEHFQAAGRWAEAGTWWQRAGLAARMAGRLLEQQELLERAAQAQRKAGNAKAEFEAVHAGFDALLIRHGGASVLAALPRLEALATDSNQLLRCRLAQAEALLDLERGAEALEVATAAERMAAEHPLLLADALSLRSMALAQTRRHDEAVRTGEHAADAALAAAQPVQELRAVRSLAYVLYSASRLGDALPVQRRAARLAEALGDGAESATAQAALGALLMAAGDVAASREHALLADRHYRAMDLARNSTVGATNLIVLGRAAAYLGRFDEALEALQEAERMAGHEATTSARAKARIELAVLLLTLGRADDARALAQAVPAAALPGLRMQAAWVLGLADQAEGLGGEVHWARLARLGEEHPQVPLMQSAWIEWSYQGPAGPALARLANLREQFLALGLPGTARTVQLRELACGLQGSATDADAARRTSSALEAAESLLPFIAQGLSAKTYPPEGWWILAQVFERGGAAQRRAECLQQAREWIVERALPSVAKEARDRFLHDNPVNRAVLAATDDARP